MDVLPLSPLQEGLLFHAVADGPGDDVYTAQLVLDLTGPWDLAALRAAAQSVVDDHPGLRAAYRQRAAGRPVQLVPDRLTLPWTEADLSDEPGRIGGVLAEERLRPFDPAKPPLFRMLLITLGRQRYRRARHRGGEARLHAEAVRPGGPVVHAPAADGVQPGEPLQPGEDAADGRRLCGAVERRAVQARPPGRGLTSAPVGAAVQSGE